MNRREFLKGTAWMGAAAMAAGCQLNRFGFGEGGQMQNYAFESLKGKRIRVGFVGLGGRGSGAVHRISMIPGVDIVALCDKRAERVERCLSWLREHKYPNVDGIRRYVGEEAYKDLCDFGECDDVSSPRPYSRIQLVSGTKGIVTDYPFRCAFEEKCFDRKAHRWFDAEKAEEIRTKYMHPLWRDLSALAKTVGGHGGMDFIMDLRWAYCLQNGLPLDTDVYDLAATSCLCELTETSVRNGSKPVSVPDFTRGNWRKAKPLGVVTVDLRKMGLDHGRVTADDAAMQV